MKNYFITIRLPFLILGLSTIFSQFIVENQLLPTIINWIVWVLCLFWTGWLITNRLKGSIIHAASIGFVFLFLWQFVLAGTLCAITEAPNWSSEGLEGSLWGNVFFTTYVVFFFAFCTAVPIGLIVSALGGYFGEKSLAKTMAE